MQPSLLVALTLSASPVLGVNVKVHHHHPMKFREVTVIEDNAVCPNGGTVLICQSASHVCQDDGTGVRKCLPRDASFLDSIDNSTRMPWTDCYRGDAEVKPKCLFELECICMDLFNIDCFCQPSDTWRTERSEATNCTTSSGEKNACDTGKYCRTKSGYQECAPAPYLPETTGLYSECSRDPTCDAGLTCKDFGNFAMCVNSDGNE